MTLTIEGLGSLGEGLARTPTGEDVFVPKTLRGDIVKVEIIEQKKGRWRGHLLEILTPSPDRQTPACPHFAYCGGCDFQHLSYDEQLAWKLRMTKHWIRRSPLAPHLEKISFDTIAAPNPLGYRHRVRFQVKDEKLHFYKPHSHELFEIQQCPVLVPGFLAALQAQAHEIKNAKDWSQSFSQGALVTDSASYRLAGHELRYDKNCFTQGNLAMNEALWARLEEDVNEVELKRKALDLYCGIGNFSLPLTDYFPSVTGVEVAGPSLTWARQNSSRVTWREGAAEDVILDLEAKREFYDLVVLDPPRAGAPRVAPVLARMQPLRITYVSCALETVVQDVAVLVKKGRYRIKRWTVADLFPQTHHIESIVTLVR